jgi:serine/threonine protein kinase/WD40 repeat protein
MSLAPGSKLGPYEIGASLGAGGMGEVYRAHDSRLQRDVAIKILPSHLSSDPVRKQRFEREAKTISGLNHPHICVLYDIGSQDGIDYLVMECIEGESLAQRLEKSALPTDQTLRIGAELADALDKAHRTGIVHRDLKPANVILTRNGVKLLDFGLAKPAAVVSLATITSVTPQQSPVTQEGTIAGTFQYMSPEQIEGKELDARSDIFSLGAVLYEMLTGKRAFEGKSQLSVASAILEKEPASIVSLKPLTPPALDRAIRRCLAKDPEERWQTARDLTLELKCLATSSAESAAPSLPPAKLNRWLPWAVTVLALVLTTVFALRSLHPASPERVVFRAAILPPDNSQFASIEADEGGVPILSPDGRYFVTPVYDTDGKVRLWLRTLSSSEGKILRGTDGAGHAFWSPDGHSIGFFAGGKLKRLDMESDASPYVLCDATLGRGGSWSTDGTILFAPHLNSQLYKIQASGGEPVQVTTFDNAQNETSHRWPQFLPDGRHFLFIIRSQKPDHTGLYVGSLDSPDFHLLLPTIFKAFYVSSGYLLFVRDELLFAQKFDPASLKLSGEPLPLPDHVGLYAPALSALFSASNTGVLAYYPAATGNASAVPYWYERSGKKLDQVAQIDSWSSTISPDGQFIALVGYLPHEWAGRLWALNIQRGTKIFLAGGIVNGTVTSPVWQPDGQSIFYGKASSGEGHIYRMKPTGGAEETVLSTAGFWEFPATICRDGKTLLYGRYSATDQVPTSLWVLPLQGDRKPFPLLQGDVHPVRAAFSPDCNWVAYEDRTPEGREVSIVHFPDGGRKYQVTSAGGLNPKWRGDGKELYYYSPSDSNLTAVPITESGQGLTLGKPVALFRIHPYVPRIGVFDVTADGQRFLVFGDTLVPNHVSLTVVINWDANLSKK